MLTAVDSIHLCAMQCSMTWFKKFKKGRLCQLDEEHRMTVGLEMAASGPFY